MSFAIVSGLDGSFKAGSKAKPNPTSIFEAYLEEGIFPTQWKKQKESVKIDAKLIFWKPFFGEAKHCRRLLLRGVMRSILFYRLLVSAEAFANSQRQQQNEFGLLTDNSEGLQRLLTTPYGTVLVVARKIPVSRFRF